MLCNGRVNENRSIARLEAARFMGIFTWRVKTPLYATKLLTIFSSDLQKKMFHYILKFESQMSCGGKKNSEDSLPIYMYINK